MLAPPWLRRIALFDFPIAENIWLLFVIIIAIAVNAFGLGYIQHRNHAATLAATELSSTVQQRALEARSAYQVQIIEWKNLLIRGQQEAAYDAHLARFEAARKQAREAVSGVRDLLDGASDAALLAWAFLQEHERLTRRYHEALTTYKLAEHNPHATTDKYVQDVERVPEVLLERLVEQARTDKATALAAMERKLATDTALAVAIFAFVNCSGMIVALLVSGRIKRSVRQLDSSIGTIQTERDLTGAIALATNDELAGIAGKLNTLLHDFADTLGEFARAGDRVTAAAGEVARRSQETGEAVLRQRAETESMVQAVGAIGVTVDQVSRSAALAAEKAVEAHREANAGRREVCSTIATINSLAEGVELSAAAVQRLAQSSGAIGNVLEVIRGIAEQTNLLALNAAIEAARAGESGRGFAVVADEVRMLASRTQEATGEIQTMIENLRRASHDAVAVMEHGRNQAQELVRQAARAGEFLEAITTAVSTISDMNGEIAASTREHSRVTASLHQSTGNIEELARETASGAQATAKVSAELEAMAEALRGQLLRYRY